MDGGTPLSVRDSILGLLHTASVRIPPCNPRDADLQWSEEVGGSVLRRRVGMILVGLGTALIVSAGVGALIPGTGGQSVSARPAASGVTTTLPPDTTTPPIESTSTKPAQTATTLPTTTSQQVTTTTTAPPTTTTTLAPEAAITAFIGDFAAAIAGEDTDWLLDHLNSAMILGYGEDLCRNFINAEILELTQYTVTGSVVGPVSKTLTTGVGDVTVSGIYTAETSFVFKGSQFDAKADFVLGDSVTWLAICR